MIHMCTLYHRIYCSVKLLLILPGMQQILADYIIQNQLDIQPMHYSLFGGQIISRGYKEKLLSVFKGLSVVCHV